MVTSTRIEWYKEMKGKKEGGSCGKPREVEEREGEREKGMTK